MAVRLPLSTLTVVEEMLQVVESGCDHSVGDAEANRDFADNLQRMQAYVGWDKLPIARELTRRLSLPHIRWSGPE